jgi:hypothetical protein
MIAVGNTVGNGVLHPFPVSHYAPDGPRYCATQDEKTDQSGMNAHVIDAIVQWR